MVNTIDKMAVFKVTINNKKYYLFHKNDKKSVMDLIESSARKSCEKKEKKFSINNQDILITNVSKTSIARTKAPVLKVNLTKDKKGILSFVHFNKSAIKIEIVKNLINESKKVKDDIKKQSQVFNFVKNTSEILTDDDVKKAIPGISSSEITLQIVNLMDALLVVPYYRYDNELNPKNNVNDWTSDLSSLDKHLPKNIPKMELFKHIEFAFKFVG